MTEQCDGLLTIDGVLMHRAAWNVLVVVDLWPGFGEQRGSDRLLPLEPGVDPKGRRPTVTRHSLPMAIFGEVDEDGAPNADLWAGLEANIAYLKANVTAPLPSPGTRPCSLAMPSGAVLTADMHVGPLRRGRIMEGLNLITGNRGTLLTATLEVSIPDSEFA